MARKRTTRLFAIAILAIASIFAICLTRLSVEVKAEVVTNVEVAKRNALYKVIYANLRGCYADMKSTIEESEDNAWAKFDSETYFPKYALNESYLQYPYGVGKKNMSSCPGLITGWNTGWLEDIFTGTGDYEGLLELYSDVTVPNTDWSTSGSANEMGKFLKNIGYDEETTDALNIGNRKCFYLVGDITPALMTLWRGSIDNFYPPSIHGNYTMESQDFCVDLGGDDYFDTNEDIIVLWGNTSEINGGDWDNGHLTDDSNVMMISFGYMVDTKPKWKTFEDILGTKDYVLSAPLDHVQVMYKYYNQDGYGGTAWTDYNLRAFTKQPTSPSDLKNHFEEYCYQLGYHHCGYYDGFWSDSFMMGISYTDETRVSYSDLKNRMKDLLANARIPDNNEYMFDNVGYRDYSPVQRAYKKGSSSEKFLNYFLKDVSKYNGGVFNDQEKYALYWSYLNEYYKVSTHDSPISDGILVSWPAGDGTFKQTYIYDPDENLNDKRYDISHDRFTNNQWSPGNAAQQNWRWFANQLASIDVATVFAADVEPIDVPPDGPTDDPQDPGTPEAAQLTCYTRSGALGWILCPIIDQGADFVADIYEKFIQPFLVLDSALFNPNETGGKATQEAWTQFQTFANLIFVVFFLFVIFSQLTGFGIDNYGIKKILPKLIIVAILINLSYFICQLAVDIANIIGYGVKTIFDGIGHLDLTKVTLAENPSGGLKNGFVATSILVVLVGLITVPVVLSQGAALLVPVFLAIIGIVIAIFTLFCILAIRKAMAVVLVVISPLAFVAYMLPNTKKLFDKWFSSFKAVLLAFPICAGMVYGGQAVARIIVLAAGSSNIATLMALSAAVMSVAPIFLIPSTLKKSMGAVASAVDRFSRGTTGRARGLFRNSNMAHDFQRRGQLSRAGVKLDKDGNVKYNLHGRLQNRLPHTKAGKQRIDAMRSDAVKAMGAASTAGTYLGAAGLKKLNTAYSAGQADIDKRRVADLEASYKRGDEGVDVTDVKEDGALQKALQAAIVSGDGDRVRALSNIAASQGDKGRTAIKNAVKGAEATDMSGATKEQRDQFAAGKKALASNLMDKYAGAFKENARSTYDWAANNQSSGQGMTMETAENEVKSNSLRGSYMNSMDDDDFDIMRKRKESYDNIIKNGGTLDGDQQKDYDNIRNAAYAAQQDQSFTATKVQRQSEINALVGDYKPESVIKSEEKAAKASADSAQGVADAIMKAQEQRDLDVHWESLSNNEKSKIFYNNPQKSGESNKDYMNRVVREYKEEHAKQMRRDRGHFDD